MRNLIYIFIVVRVATNIQQLSDTLYFIGRDLFEIGLLYYIYSTTQGRVKELSMFCITLAGWNLIKPLFVNPRITDYYEIIGFIIGILVLIYDYKKRTT